MSFNLLKHLSSLSLDAQDTPRSREKAAYAKATADVAKLASDGALIVDIGVLRGVEKENLRVSEGGRIATTPHPKGLGHSLTHTAITTDFSEGLLEFVTPPLASIDALEQQLLGLQQFALASIKPELLWASSMPPMVRDPLNIQIADFGRSDCGQRKRIYREGLALRYGKIMQVIAGIHFNFSFPADFMQQISQATGLEADDLYMAQVRQLLRYMWLIPYLFGASPAAARSSVTGPLPACLNHYAPASVMGEYATSMRLGDLGYHNKGRELINIDYSSVKAYAKSLHAATTTPFAEYADLVAQHSSYRQLNANVLQIENEFYSPVRPKQVIKPGEAPSVALCERGVAYIELRALDLDPFTANGISQQTIAFLDIMMFHSMLSVSDSFKEGEFKLAEANLKQVAMQGRKPKLALQTLHGASPMRDLAASYFAEFEQVASWLDQQVGGDFYRLHLAEQNKKFTQPELTPSARIASQLIEHTMEYDAWVLAQSEQHTAWLDGQPRDAVLQQDLQRLVEESNARYQQLKNASD